MSADRIDDAATAVTARPTPPAAGDHVVGICRCGHGAEAHRHFRSGDDCGACGSNACRTYRRSGTTGVAGRVRGLAAAAQVLRRPRAR